MASGSRGQDRGGRWSCRSRSGGGCYQSQRGFDRLGRLFQDGGSHVFAGLHGRYANEIAAAGQDRAAAESHDVLAFFEQERLLRPLDLVAFAEGGDGGAYFIDYADAFVA